MSILRTAIAKKLRDVATAPTTEEALIMVEIATNHVRDFVEGAILKFHCCWLWHIVARARPLFASGLRAITDRTKGG